MHAGLRSTPRPPAARGWARWAGLLLAVLLVHAWLLAGLPLGTGVASDARPRVLTVRQIAPVPAPAARPAEPATPELPKPHRPAAAVARTAAATAPPAAVEPAPALPMAAEVPTGTAHAAESAAAGDAEALPVYATRLPPPTALAYEMRRGPLTGTGQLSWQSTGDGYELQLQGFALGLPLLAWVSRGGHDAAGLAPQRFVDQRRGRSVRAANFQRERGVVSWSSVSREAPLVAGAQDRLSWMVQLAAVLEAEPLLRAAGQQVLMQVAGARGDIDTWAFVVQGREAVELVGAVAGDALLLRREPRQPFDTLVQVWLDPSRHHLPVRLKLSNGGGEGMEFLLKP